MLTNCNVADAGSGISRILLGAKLHPSSIIMFTVSSKFSVLTSRYPRNSKGPAEAFVPKILFLVDMGWFWADTVTVQEPVAHTMSTYNSTPPVSRPRAYMWLYNILTVNSPVALCIQLPSKLLPFHRVAHPLKSPQAHVQ